MINKTNFKVIKYYSFVENINNYNKLLLVLNLYKISLSKLFYIF